MICKICNRVGEFRLGNKSTCKRCLADRVNKYRHDFPDKEIASRLRNAEKRKVRQNAYYKKWYAENGRKRDPLKQAAHTMVLNAVRAGRLKRPDSCPECSRRMKIEAHHHDYLKPLDVVWLCNRCHRLIHKGFTTA